MPQRRKPLPRVIRYTYIAPAAGWTLLLAHRHSTRSNRSIALLVRVAPSAGATGRVVYPPVSRLRTHRPAPKAGGSPRHGALGTCTFSPTAPVTSGTLTPLRSRARPCSPLSMARPRPGVAAVSRRFPCPPPNRGWKPLPDQTDREVPCQVPPARCLLPFLDSSGDLQLE